MTTVLDVQSETVRLAYDRIAASYDRQVSDDDWMRRVLWRRYLDAFEPGDRVLDIACGTGLDTIFLARSGICVTAIDISGGMIGQLRASAERQGVSDLIDAREMNLNALSTLPEGSFHGIVSGFAGLNTTPDLHQFARDAGRLLRPEGRLILHMLNRVSLWEWLSLVWNGKWDSARCLGRSAERDFLIGGLAVRHYLCEPIDVYERVFGSSFTLRSAFSLGSLRPPHTIRVLPDLIVRGLGSLELKLGAHRPLLNLGRFFVLDMARRPDDGHDR